MKIVVTGGAGYIGSHVTRELVKGGYEVIVVDTMELGYKEALPKEAGLVVGNVGDEEVWKKILKENEVEAVLHFAGYASVPESVGNPQKYFANNLVNSGVMLKSLVEGGVKKLIFSSTAAVYGDPGKVPIPEEHPKRPTNPYGLSKWCFEQLLEYYDRMFGLRSISLRYFNACGAARDGNHGEAHEPETHIIPRIIQTIIGEGEFSLFGTDYKTSDGTCLRDYIHVDDLASAHILALKALEKGGESEVFNIGTGKGWTNRQVVKSAENVTEKKVNLVEKGRRPGDPGELVADSSKIQKKLNWRPQFVDIDDIMETAWKWHLSHPNGYNK